MNSNMKSFQSVLIRLFPPGEEKKMLSHSKNIQNTDGKWPMFMRMGTGMQ